jgi:hypothetical protein
MQSLFEQAGVLTAWQPLDSEVPQTLLFQLTFQKMKAKGIFTIETEKDAPAIADFAIKSL